jgi:hypothetical protein
MTIFRTVMVSGVLFSGSLALFDAARVQAAPGAHATPAQTPAGPAALTPAQAAPFLGDWTLALQGPNGPASADLSVKTEQEKVVAELTMATMAPQAITNISLVEKSLSLAYSFDYDGNAVDAVVWLTPGADGSVAAQIDFAGGAYVMSGTASKKQPAPGTAAAPR